MRIDLDSLQRSHPLREILQTDPDVDAAARALVEAALDNGARDNVTALVVRYEAAS